LRCHLGYSLSRISFVADDGTPLTWTVFTPTTPGPWPAVLVIHGWFWIAGEETDSGFIHRLSLDFIISYAEI